MTTTTINTAAQFKTLAEVEREHILAVFEANGGNRRKTSRVLGIDVKTLYNKLKGFGVRPVVGGK